MTEVELRKVAIVDDDVAVRDSLRFLLEVLGYSVETFASAAEFGGLVREELLQLEEHHRCEAKSLGRRFLGAFRALAQDPHAHPRRCEPRFRLKPRIASRDPSRRIGALLELKKFLRDYRAAWLERRSGATNVVFPAGTYLLRVLHGVQCAGAA